MKIKREARKNYENENSKEVVEKESEKNMSGKEEEVEHKKICFATNNINSSFSSVDFSLKQEFKEEFLTTVHNVRAKFEDESF